MTIPFAKWGIDILGPLPLTLAHFKFYIVGIDYFTKWVETEPLVTIIELHKFLYNNIIYWFGVLEHIVTNNTKQFDSGPFEAFY